MLRAAGCERTAGLDARGAAAGFDGAGAWTGCTGTGLSQLLDAALLHVGDSSSICSSCSSSQQESATCGMRRDALTAAGSFLDSAAWADLPVPAMQNRSPSSVGLRTWLTALSRLLQELRYEGWACSALLLPQLLALLVPTLCCMLSGCSTGLSLVLPVGLTCCLVGSDFWGSTCLNTLLLQSDCSESLTENVLVSTDACCCGSTGLHVQVQERISDQRVQTWLVVLCRPRTPTCLVPAHQQQQQRTRLASRVATSGAEACSHPAFSRFGACV